MVHHAPLMTHDRADLTARDERLLTVPQVAELLSISERQVKRLVSIGSLRVVRIGRLVRVDPTELSRFISAAGALAPARPGGRRPAHHQQVGPRIAYLVLNSGLTQTHIAERLHMSREALGDRLRCRTRWSADEIPAIAAVLGVRPSTFFGEDDR